MLRVLLLALAMAVAPFSATAQTQLLSADNSASVAVIIGNKNYRYASRFPVEYAQNDAAAVKDYLVRFLRFDERNIILETDATKAVFDDLFRPEGTLSTRVREGRSNVFVFYSGHGVPDLVGRQAYLLPTDVHPDSPQQGYALETLYQSLSLIKQRIGPDRQVVVMIDACFSGESGRGERFVSGSSAPGFQPARPRSGDGLIKLVATSGTHPANWDDTLKLGLFTSRFLMGVAGLAAAPGAGGSGGTVQWNALRDYVRNTVDADAHRLVKREQRPEIDEADLALPVGEVAALGPTIKLVRDEVAWRKAESSAANAPADDFGQQALAYQGYRADCARNGCAHGAEADQKLGELREQRLVAEDRANWTRLSVAGKHRDYLDTCVVGPCAYRKFAEEEIGKLAAAYLERGRGYAAKGDYDQAVEQYNEALKLDPKYAVAYNNRGNVYRDKKDYIAAIADYNQAIKLDPKFALPYNDRGYANYLKKDYDRAIADYGEAIKLDPKNALAYNRRGSVYYERKNYDRAIADYGEAIKLDPKNAVAYYSRGNVYRDNSDLTRAIADYSEAIKLAPKYAWAYNNRGNAHFGNKDYDRAIADYDEAIKLDPKYTWAYNNRGNAYFGKKGYDRAIADYDEAIKLDPKYVVAYASRGLAKEALGRKAEAIADFNKAQSINPTDLVSRNGLWRLGSPLK